jgi:mannose-6-phosphate isomerase-like protein (cupin superfamily)
MNFETSTQPYLPRRVDKKWGYELWVENNNEYCGKILHFNKGSKFSCHFHSCKKESWYVLSGYFEVKFIDTKTAEIKIVKFGRGQALTVKRLMPHQIFCLEEGDIMEVSTPHHEEDSYRVSPGDSQSQ